ncbi:anthranilate synthase component II [Chryseobacterium sp. A301]
MKVLLIDNYDSFTYNLAQLIERILEQRITVVKNDELSSQLIKKFDKIVLSPGPGIPSEAGSLLEVIKEFYKEKSILGVCLGMQAIAESFGGSLRNGEKVYHGISTQINITRQEAKLYKNLSNSIRVGRYHSWTVDPHTLPEDLEITAEDDHGTVMSLQHKKYDLHGVQYHPESILTPEGKTIVSNFLLNSYS